MHLSIDYDQEKSLWVNAQQQYKVRICIARPNLMIVGKEPSSTRERLSWRMKMCLLTMVGVMIDNLWKWSTMTFLMIWIETFFSLESIFNKSCSQIRLWGHMWMYTNWPHLCRNITWLDHPKSDQYRTNCHNWLLASWYNIHQRHLGNTLVKCRDIIPV